LKFDNFWSSEFHNGSGTKIVFNSCEFIQFLNNGKFHAFHVWGKCILSLMIQHSSLTFFSFFCFCCNSTFSTPVTSLNLCNQAPLAELRFLQGTHFCNVSFVKCSIFCHNIFFYVFYSYVLYRIVSCVMFFYTE